MSDIDDAIDRLYQGPLQSFTDARNALAKSAKRPDVKTLAKPSLPAWAVNQLHWQRAAVLDRLIGAAESMRTQHTQALAGKAADVRAAEQAHRDAVREALAAARDLLTAAGHPATPATLDAIRETLQALPSPEANGRLVRPLAPRGFEALAGLAVTARPPLRVVPRADTPPAAAKRSREAGEAPAPRAAEDLRQAREAERVRAREEAERQKREREEQRRAAKAVLDDARAELKRAESALADAEREVMRRRADRKAAADAVERAAKVLRE
jgi:hypothetical protein